MRFAEYVVAGWALTAALLGAYWVRLSRRTRNAARNLSGSKSES